MAGVIVGSTDSMCAICSQNFLYDCLASPQQCREYKERDPIVGNSSFTYSFGTWDVLGIVESQGLSCHVL